MSYYDHLNRRVLLAVDCIIFGFDEEDLKVLLIKRDFEPEKGKWSLVGGFLKENETLDIAAIRILKTHTGLDNIFMDQVAIYSEIERDPAERTVSTSYYALVNIKKYDHKLNHQFSAQWFSISNAPNLVFDHNKIMHDAYKKLQLSASLKPIGLELLPEKFTMRQLQKLYEAIWNIEIDKRNFINKIRSLGIVKKLDEKDKTSSKKGSYLYKFDLNKYYESGENEFALKFLR